jgi:hypothetical protein
MTWQVGLITPIANRFATNQAKEQLLAKGKELIALIKKEYHLENE